MVIGNNLIQREVSLRDGVLRTERIISPQGGHCIELDSEEFILALVDGRQMTASDFEVVDTRQEDEGGRAATVFTLKHRDLPIEAEVEFEMPFNDFVLRKRLRFRSTGQDLALECLEVERFRCAAPMTRGGRGQPLFLDHAFFLGLEYPAGFNEAEGEGTVLLRHYPDRVPAGQWLQSKTAVLGAAIDESIPGAFNDYIQRIRRKCQPFVSFNTGADVQIYEPVTTPDNRVPIDRHLLHLAGTMISSLREAGGPSLDTFVLDAGWQNPESLYEIDRRKFPNGLEPLSEELGAVGAHLGLWLSLTTPLSPVQLSREYLEAQGYGIAVPAGRHPCISEPAYNAALRQVLRTLVEEHGVRHFKFDFNYFQCTAPGHGHPTGEKQAYEANLDAHIDILHFVASLNAEVRIIPTCGMWLSPWWLMHADAIWPQGMWDFNYCRRPVALEPCDWAITYRDENLFQLLTKEEAEFPLSGITFCGILGGPRYRISGPKALPEKFIDVCVHAHARQLKLSKKEIGTPLNRTKAEWEAMCRTINWALHRCGQVSEGKMVLGSPGRGEVYGYLHAGESVGVLSLRNPSIYPQEATLPEFWDREDEQTVVEVTYPYRRVLSCPGHQPDGLKTTLCPHEVMVIEAKALSESALPIIEGCRYSIAEMTGGVLEFDLFPDGRNEIRIVSPAALRSVEVDGAAIGAGHAGDFTIPVNETEPARDLYVQNLGIIRDKEGHDRRGVRVDIPPAEEAKLVIIVKESFKGRPVISVNMGGWFSGLPFQVTHGDGWSAFSIELDPADLNTIHWRFDLSEESASEASEVVLLTFRRKLCRHQLCVAVEDRDVVSIPPQLPAPFAALRSETHILYPSETGEREFRLPWMQEW